MPGSDAPPNKPHCTDPILPESEIAIFCYPQGPAASPRAARQEFSGKRLFEQAQQGPAGSRLQLFRVQRTVIVGIGSLEALLDDREVFVER